jgi:peptidoglycan/xylan/chitin deacetylase (PgdA/CDA1 family)
MQLAIRVDVDTRAGLREGVPRLLDLFKRRSLRASFFVSFGPDNSGRALRRIWRPGFLLKMWRTNPLRVYGLRTLLSGTLLPALPVGEGAPDILESIMAQGHELGIHGYDHVLWQDRVERMDEKEIEGELCRAKAAYERLLGACPLSSAAPGWRCTPASLAVQDRLGFLYASDVRGTSPFFPVHNGRRLETLQIPTTLPTLDELLGRKKAILDLLFDSLREGLNVHTIHAEVEGGAHLAFFECFLREVERRGVQVLRLRDLAERILRNGVVTLPRVSVRRDTIPGRSGWVACQGTVADSFKK